MTWDVSYDDLAEVPYNSVTITGGRATRTRQSVAFLLQDGTVKLAVMDMRELDSSDTSESFVLIGKIQLSRSRLTNLHTVEVEGMTAGSVHAIRSVDGRTFDLAEVGTLRTSTDDYREYGFDMLTGKNYAVLVRGNYYLSSLLLTAGLDGRL
jgi:hypothetical protein